MNHVINKYFDKNPITINKIDEGKVNQTFMIEYENKKFIIQKMSKMLSSQVTSDYNNLYHLLNQQNITIPKLHKSKQGNLYHSDKNSQTYRIYEYLPNTKCKKTEKLIFNTFSFMGKLHETLKQINYSPKFKINNHHNTKHYYNKLKTIYNSKQDEIEDQLKPFFKIIFNQMPKYYIKETKPQLIHGDPKMTNFLYDINENVLTIIDFDNITILDKYFDIGDAIRSFCCDDSYNFNIRYFNSALNGYKTKSQINKTKALQSTMLITLELMTRYLIDYFEREYFNIDLSKWKTYENYYLTRVRQLSKFYHSTKPYLYSKIINH